MAKPVRGSTAKHKGEIPEERGQEIHLIVTLSLPLSVESPSICPSLTLGKATPIFTFTDGRCEVMLTLDLKEGTLRFMHAGRNIGTIASIKGPVHAAVTVTTSKQTARWFFCMGRLEEIDLDSNWITSADSVCLSSPSGYHPSWPNWGERAQQ